jgi:hypothetical protein
VGTTYCTIGYTGKSWALPCLALPLILDTVLIHTLECFNILSIYQFLSLTPLLSIIYLATSREFRVLKGLHLSIQSECHELHVET